MRTAAANKLSTTTTGHTVVRLLITSYFIAAAIGVISATDVSVMAAPFLPDLHARVLMAVITVGLSTLILVGIQRRAAALLLALILFWSSYISILSIDAAQPISSFWRDLALIGALLMTYADRENARANDAAALAARFARGSQNSLASEQVAFAPKQRSRIRPVTRQYREDLDQIRAT